jgi:hypothetical protein
MLSNLSDLLNQRVDPKATQQVATAADSSAVLVNNPALRQFYSPQRGYTPVQTFAPGKVPAKYSFTPEQITDKVKSAVELNKQVMKTSGGKILNAYPGTWGAIQNAMRDEETKRKFYKDDAETATAKKNILNDKTGFVNKYRFQTRDNIPNEINFAAPYNITDTRIAPQKTVLYESKTDPGAVTLIHQYDELMTTPWAKLNEKQKEARLKVPGGIKGTPYDPELKKRGFNPLPLPGKTVAQVAVNPPAKAKYLPSTKKSTQKASDAEIEKWLNQSGEEPAGEMPVESSSSMVAMAPQGTYIQNAPANVQDNEWEYSKPIKMVVNPGATGTSYQPITMGGTNIDPTAPNEFSHYANVIEQVGGDGTGEDSYETLPFGYKRKKVSKKSGGLPPAWKDDTSKMSKEEVVKYIEQYYANPENKKWWEGMNVRTSDGKEVASPKTQRNYGQ